MRRRLATLAAAAAFALALSASPVLASPVTVDSFPALGETVGCGDHVYSFTSGDFALVTRDPSLAAHLTARHVRATDGHESFRVVGAETYSDPAGRLTAKLMFIRILQPDERPDARLRSRGGIADSLNIVLRSDDGGNMVVGFSRGTCGF